MKQDKSPQNHSGETIRLNKWIADSGYCSRREADRLIENGSVTVDRQPAEIGQRIRPNAQIRIDGKLLQRKKPDEYRYLALNKPTGITCTTDLRRRDNIVSFLNLDERIYPIGRLDRDSEGLILMTNDGSIVNRILRAEYNHEKEYIVRVDRPLTREFIQRMSHGVPILKTVTKPCKLKQITGDTFRIVLTQGLNRQIRRMCEALGYQVVSLQRVRIMHITLGSLKTGEYRELTYKELQDLETLLSQSEAQAQVQTQTSRKSSSKEAKK